VSLTLRILHVQGVANTGIPDDPINQCQDVAVRFSIFSSQHVHIIHSDSDASSNSACFIKCLWYRVPFPALEGNNDNGHWYKSWLQDQADSKPHILPPTPNLQPIHLAMCSWSSQGHSTSCGKENRGSAVAFKEVSKCMWIWAMWANLV
jgi:hypothetical protein